MLRLNRNLMIAAAIVSGVFACAKSKDVVNRLGDEWNAQGDFESQSTQELSIGARGVSCIVHQLSVTPNSMVMTQIAFENNDCTGEPLGKIITRGKYSIGNEVQIEPGARELDFIIVRVVVVPLNSRWVHIFGIDITGECDVSKVPIGQEYDVTGRNCGHLGRFPSQDQIYFTSINVHKDTMSFTKLPSEAWEHVGTREKAAERNQKLVITYHRK